MTTKIKSNNITAGSITADLLHVTAITDKLGYTPADANNVISSDEYARDKANGAYDQANSASLYANTGITLAQDAYNQGNSTATVANTKFNSDGGTITGTVTISGNNDLTITGNLYVQGNTVTTNTQSFVVADPVILLASGNFFTDAKDIGFAAHYNAGTNAHTGFIRDYVTKEYYLFHEYTPEMDANNEININDESFKTANVHANFFKGNVIGTSVVTSSLGVGTPASGVTGEIRAANNVTAYFSSDKKFKENVQTISDALSKVESIGGKTFDWTDEYIKDHGGEDGYFVQKEDFGVIAQDVQAVFPQAIRTRPDGSLAVDYSKLAALAFAAIAELSEKVKKLEKN
jgi:hypothetical protein